MTQSGADKHQGTFSIGKGANDACPATNFPVEAFYGVVGTDILPMFFRKVHVYQGLSNAIQQLVCCLVQLHPGELLCYEIRFL